MFPRNLLNSRWGGCQKRSKTDGVLGFFMDMLRWFDYRRSWSRDGLAPKLFRQQIPADRDARQSNENCQQSDSTNENNGRRLGQGFVSSRCSGSLSANGLYRQCECLSTANCTFRSLYRQGHNFGITVLPLRVKNTNFSHRREFL